MPADARERLAELLGGLEVPGSFSAQRTAPVDDLSIEVRGIGHLRFPVPEHQVRQLREIGRPARYGRGEQTLLDRRVRDTLEIPPSRVKIDKRRWAKTLLPVLDALREELGLPQGCRLEAELHSMLVYGPGQFFLPHQDSEKRDEMVGSLVVTLPAPFAGGALVVEHDGAKAIYRGSKKALSFVAFYADCRHEVKPVRSGHRIVLTHNLMLGRDGAELAAAGAPPETVEELAGLIEQHFATPPPPRWQGDREAGDAPSRLVYLLDHQYTERGLSWSRLKGADAPRAAMLRQAADRAGCETVLGLGEVHETWSAYEREWDDPWHRGSRYRSWEWDEEEDDEEDEEFGGEQYELDELIESSVDLKCWIEPTSPKARPVSLSASEREVCATTPSDELEPCSSEYEGYMGNWGNTLDRWYRRGAVVLWPKQKAFAVRAEAEPAWALDSISARLRSGKLAEAREMAASLAPFWSVAARGEQPSRFVASALRIAGGVDEPALARMLLEPLVRESLGKTHAASLAALVERYGDDFLAGLLQTWSARRRRWGAAATGHEEWAAKLARLSEALAARGATGGAAALLLVKDSWRQLAAEVSEALDLPAPSRRERALQELAALFAAVLHSAGLLHSTRLLGAAELREEVVSFCQGRGDELVSCLVQALRAATALTPALRGAADVDVLALHCARRLASRLARPLRDAGDWSIEAPGGCGCALCGTLSVFLSDPARHVFEWPLAEQRRRHIHAMIDAAELPVRHETRRRGRPYTLVLTKTEALFETERQARARDQAAAAWLAAAFGPRRQRSETAGSSRRRCGDHYR